MPLNVELFRKVQAAIQAEPRRFEMGQWLQVKRGRSRVNVTAPVTLDGTVDNWEFAECGTAACLAGWAVLADKIEDVCLAKPKEIKDVAKTMNSWSWDIPRHGRELLGISYDARDRLFYADSWPRPFRGRYMKAIIANDPVAAAQAASDLIDHIIAHPRNWEAK